jgi:hypothetical protein
MGLSKHQEHDMNALEIFNANPFKVGKVDPSYFTKTFDDSFVC